MAHKVICVYCSEQFDRDKEECEKVSSRRYAHKHCHDERKKLRSQDETEKEKLRTFLIDVLKIDADSIKVRNQTKSLVEKKGFTYKAILKCLTYFYVVKGNNTEKANGGIGIVEYVYEEALKYYQDAWIINQMNNEKDIKILTQTKDIIIEIDAPQRKTNQKESFLFTFLD